MFCAKLQRCILSTFSDSECLWNWTSDIWLVIYSKQKDLEAKVVQLLQESNKQKTSQWETGHSELETN